MIVTNSGLSSYSVGNFVTKNMKLEFTLAACLAVLFFACKNSGHTSENTDTPTSGSITIGCDPTLEPLARAEIQAFNVLYPKADIQIKLLNENEAFNALLVDSVRLIIAARDVTADEKKQFDQKQQVVKSRPIARDGIAFITHATMPDKIKYTDLLSIISGKMQFWNQLDKSLPAKEIQLVFDDSKSSTVLNVASRTAGEIGKNVSAFNSNQKVINYVTENISAIGIIGLSWISDGQDQTTGSFIKNIHVMGIDPGDTCEFGGTYYKPFQAYLLKRIYPFYRDVHAIVNEPRNGLGNAFVAFLAHQTGQTVVQQKGLLPLAQRAWIRPVEIKK